MTEAIDQHLKKAYVFYYLGIFERYFKTEMKTIWETNSKEINYLTYAMLEMEEIVKSGREYGLTEADIICPRAKEMKDSLDRRLLELRGEDIK